MLEARQGAVRRSATLGFVPSRLSKSHTMVLQGLDRYCYRFTTRAVGRCKMAHPRVIVYWNPRLDCLYEFDVRAYLLTNAVTEAFSSVDIVENSMLWRAYILHNKGIISSTRIDSVSY